VKSILLSLLIGLSFFSTAQTEIELNPVTVIATLQPLPVSRTGRNITTIPGNYFDKLPVHSIDELLRFVPGVEVQQRGPAGSQSDIVLRGGTFQQVLVILDGIRLNDPTTGHFNSYIPIAPAELEKIEVLKGASSAIYGSEAVGGVINIVTKSFAAKRDQTKKQLSVAASAGEYDLFNAAGGGYWQKNNTAIGGGFLTNNSDGQPQRGTRGFFNNHTASFSLKQFINDHWSIAVRSSFDERKFGAQNFYTTFLSDTANEKVTSNWNQSRISFQKNKHTINLDAGYKFVKDIYQYNPQSIANDNRSNLLQLLLTDHYKINSKTILTSGLQYQDRRIRSNDRGNHSLNQVAAFFILHQKFNDFSVNPSIRIDYGEERGTELIPQINLSYQLHRFQFRASAGKTIRDADFTERYNNYNKTFVPGGSIGNPDLISERSFSYEAGADYFANKNFKLSITAFQRRHTQLIDWVPTPYSEMPRKENLSPTGTYALAKNIAKVNTTGVEADIQFNRSFNKSNHFFSTFGLVWLDSKSSDAAPSFYISSHANFLANLSAEYVHKRFSIAVTAIYKNREERKASAINAAVNKNCFLMNAKATIFFWDQRLAVFAEVDNVFDSTCSDLLGSQLPGSWLMGGIKLSL
jgi:iron complex outermembrane receptor protein